MSDGIHIPTVRTIGELLATFTQRVTATEPGEPMVAMYQPYTDLGTAIIEYADDLARGAPPVAALARFEDPLPFVDRVRPQCASDAGRPEGGAQPEGMTALEAAPAVPNGRDRLPPLPEPALCPFDCDNHGGRPAVQIARTAWQVHCNACGARGPVESTELAAIERWNRRPAAKGA